MITPGARAVLDAARRILEVLPLEGLEWADLMAATTCPGDVVRHAVQLLQAWGVVWEEAGAVYPAPGWIGQGPAVIARATRILDAVPPRGCPISDLEELEDIRWLHLILEGLLAAGLIRWAPASRPARSPGRRGRVLEVVEAP